MQTLTKLETLVCLLLIVFSLGHNYIETAPAASIKGKFVTYLNGSTAPISTVDIMSDGNLITGDNNGDLMVWNKINGKLERTIHTDSAILMSAGMITPRNYVACGLNNSNIQIYNPADGSLYKTFSAHRGFIYSFSTFPFSPSMSSYLASGSSDGTVVINDVTARKPLVALLAGHKGTVNSIVELPGGKLASASDDKTIIIWDTKKWTKSIQLSDKDKQPVQSLLATKNALISGNNVGHITIWNLMTWKPVNFFMNIHSDQIWSIISLPNGDFASGSFDATIKVWDSKGKVKVTMQANASVWAIAYSNSYLAAGLEASSLNLEIWQ